MIHAISTLRDIGTARAYGDGMKQITAPQIRTLLAKAAKAGDTALIDNCEVALAYCRRDGTCEDHPAVRACMAAIRAAEAQQ